MNFEIGDKVKLIGSSVESALAYNLAISGTITSINASWFRIAGEQDGYPASHLDFIEDEYDIAVRILGEDYFA